MRSMRNCFSLELQSERTSFASVSYFETSRGELSYKSASIVVSRAFAVFGREKYFPFRYFLDRPGKQFPGKTSMKNGNVVN